MKVKVSEATPTQLDWLVAKCQGYTDLNPSTTDCQRRLRTHNYSSNWNKAGPIIHREEINLEVHEGGHTRASFYKMRPAFDGKSKHYHHQHGPTPLVAAMRCFVASKLGDEVDVPEELL